MNKLHTDSRAACHTYPSQGRTAAASAVSRCDDSPRLSMPAERDTSVVVGSLCLVAVSHHSMEMRLLHL